LLRRVADPGSPRRRCGDCWP